MNEPILQFIINHWLSLAVAIILLIPTVSYSKLNLFSLRSSETNKNIKVPLLLYIFHIISRSLFELTFATTFKGTICLVIFLILGIDLYYNHTLNSQSVVLIITGMLSLYLDKLVDQGNEIKFFSIFTWKRDPRYKKEDNQS